MKVVWLCNLNLYPFSERLNIEKELFKGRHPVTWITTLYKKFSEYRNIELTIISTSQFIKKVERFESENVHFIIIPKNHSPFPSRAELNRKYPPVITWILRLFLIIPKRTLGIFKIIDIYSGYRFFIFRVVKIIKKINPDIVHAHGTEFVYSIPLNYLKFPAIVQIQGLMSSVVTMNNSLFPRLQKRIEDDVFRKQKNFIINADFIKKIINTHNPSAKFWKIFYMVDIGIFKTIPIMGHNTDLVFAAAICKHKGIEDLLEACKQVKKRFPDFKLKIIGYNSSDYVKYLYNLINEYNLTDNIIFLGFIPDRREMLMGVKKSRISVLPTYHDTQPGTIIEAMFLGVAVVAYNVGGVPDMIIHNESGLLVEKGDINQLAASIIELLANGDKRNFLINKAKVRAELLYNKNVADEMIKAYSEVIEDFKAKGI